LNRARPGEKNAMPRELIEPHTGDKHYARRDAKGHFTKKQVDVGRSLTADRRSKAKTIAKKGEGDRGDRGT
jgi:hypothetical protein